MAILIPCPQCGRELKLPDQKLLGRKGKCPKCGHTFVLQLPSARPVAPVKNSAEKNEPLLAKAETPAIDRPQSDVGSGSQRLLVESRAENDESTMPFFERHVSDEMAATATAFPSQFATFDTAEGSNGPAARLKELQRQHVRRRNMGLIAAVVIGCVAIAIALLGPRANNKTPPVNTTAESSDQTEAQPVTDVDDDRRVDEDGLDPSRTEYAKMGNPTQGKPIELQYIPFGTQVIVNLHPAALWKDPSLGELRSCVPPLASLIESTITDLFQCPPEEIQEMLICLMPGARGTPPNVAAVAHLTADQEQAQIIERLGLRKDASRDSIYVAGQRAYMIVDLKTVVVCPHEQVDEMLKAINDRHPVEQIDPLLSLTDRDRQITVLFTPLTVALHDAWLAENVRPLVKSSLDWLGDDVETVLWSVHLTDQLCHAELVLRNRQGTAKKLYRDIRRKLIELAERLVPLIQQMNPKEQGKRLVIGRVPAMIEVFSLATMFQLGQRQVQLTTPLPSRAAANIFLGTFLAWDESTRTDFSKAMPISTEGKQLPATVAERLELKIDVDFRSAPFSEAFSFISGEIKTPIELDGDAIKAGGFTKNLKQSFQLDAVPVKAVIARIFVESKSVEGNPEKRLVVVVDETEKKLLITTSAAADKKGLKAKTLE